MKLFILNISIIILMVLLMFAVSLLLELTFITKQFSRELLVYLLMMIVLFVGIRILWILNKDEGL